MKRAWLSAYVLMFALAVPSPAATARHPVPTEHPRLLGSRHELQELARRRPAEYQRVVAVARGQPADDHSTMLSLALVAAIDRDSNLGRQAQQLAMKFINGPIRQGHVTFGSDLALCAIAFDMCYDSWNDADRLKFHDYMNRTVDANANSETHVFHNGWYGYKNWGIGLACYATYYENPRAPDILRVLEEDYRTRAAPALELAGDGGGWAEGYYIHYFLYEWLFFCEAARRCEGIDYYALAPKFFHKRAIASMFETYPGICEYGSRRCAPMGDSGGRLFGGDRDKALSARRILVNHFRNDPEHQAVHAFNETTPRSSVGVYAYKDFLWRNTAVPPGDLAGFRLSHYSPGPGYVYARSSWKDDATYFFFKCGDRFTAHQHLDVGHFLVYKHEELAGDGGHYDSFGSLHDVNYHLRSIAHNTMLVYDPAERWPGIRAGNVTSNDGGQAHSWPHYNGAVVDAAEWQKNRRLYDIADVLAFKDAGDYLYVAGNATRAYSANKLVYFTRQIVFLRPGAFVIFDRVQSTKPEFKKTWALQAMKPPSGTAPNLLVTNGKGRLFVQMLLPDPCEVRLVSGDELYRYGGQVYVPRKNTGAAPECRVEISPAQPKATDLFLHVLTATGAEISYVPQAVCHLQQGQALVELDATKIAFGIDELSGKIEINGRRADLPSEVLSARLAIERSDNQVMVSFPGQSGVNYQVESTSDLANWILSSDCQLGIGRMVAVPFDTAPAPWQFYRVLGRR
jgi:hypothetical protein